MYGTNGLIWGGGGDFQTETWEKRSIPMSTSPQKLLKSVKLVFGGLYVGDVWLILCDTACSAARLFDDQVLATLLYMY